MLIGEVLGFWFLVGVAFFGVRRLAHRKDAKLPRVIAAPNGRRS